MKLIANAGVRGINLMGVEYVCDVDGCINVPDDLASVALESGFSIEVSTLAHAPTHESAPVPVDGSVTGATASAADNDLAAMASQISG